MNRNRVLAVCGILAVAFQTARADVVLDWNATIRNVMQTDGIANSPALANPGWSTRTIAMMNGAIYDTFQTLNRTSAPLIYTALTPLPNNYSRDAAAAQAAYDVILGCYPLRTDVLNPALTNSLASIPDSAAKTAGIALGHTIAQQYMSARSTDGAASGANYTPSSDPGKWRPDPYNPGQVAWGPQYGQVPTFMVHDSSLQMNAHDLINALPSPPALNSPEYTAAFNQVQDYGALSTYGAANTPTHRTADETAMGLFWAYDRASMGPPPVLFVRNLEEISKAVGNTPEQNAKLFAMASVSMADAAIAAWDAKFQKNFWRPVTGIQEADTDGNADTTKDGTWRPLGAPGNNPSSSADDFTPPFPSWTSGHATMGSALYQTIELFYGTNNFVVADANNGADPVTSLYTLNSDEAGAGGVGTLNGARPFGTFLQTGILDVGTENSPEGENGMSRVYLGVHWIFDQRDGMTLGRSIASFVAANGFQAVPEPSTFGLSLLAAVTFAGRRRRSRATK